MHAASNVELPEKINDYVIIIKAIIKAGADKNIKNNNDQTPLMIAQNANVPKKIIEAIKTSETK